MGPAPAAIGGRRVLAYSPIDGRHRYVGNERRWVDNGGEEVLYGPADGLAICEESGSGPVVLVGCDEDWRPVWETRCTTPEAAARQAEYEYPGVGHTWVRSE